MCQSGNLRELMKRAYVTRARKQMGFPHFFMWGDPSLTCLFDDGKKLVQFLSNFIGGHQTLTKPLGF